MTSPEPRMHTLMLASMCLLMLGTVWLFWQALPAMGVASLLAAMLLTLPLAVPLPALWRRKRAAAIWTGYLLMPYLAVALMEAVANPSARLASAIVTLLLLLTLFALIAWLRTSRPKVY